MPSTKELSLQMKVSLVTAHRALQELVGSGVLSRTQGRGTFVHSDYVDTGRRPRVLRIGLVFHKEVSLADYYHSQVLEGVRQAGEELLADVNLLRFGEEVRNDCTGYLYINPLPRELESLQKGKINHSQRSLVVGAASRSQAVRSIDVDNIELARIATAHLIGLGHTRLGFVGGADQISNSRDRWAGFASFCRERDLVPAEADCIRARSWKLNEQEIARLLHVLSSDDRPTAIFAAGYYFALDVYGAAARLGLKIPTDLSVIGVDDPPSAAHLSPSLTTLRQPLVQLGRAALTMLCGQLGHEGSCDGNRIVLPELVTRESTARGSGTP